MFTSIGSAVASEQVPATLSCRAAVQPPVGSVNVTVGAVSPVPPIALPRCARTSGEVDDDARAAAVAIKTEPTPTRIEARWLGGDVSAPCAPVLGHRYSDRRTDAQREILAQSSHSIREHPLPSRRGN